MIKDIHDRQYKKVFSTPILAQKLLTSFVHEKFIKHLDFDTMTRKDKSYVTPNMKKYESDIVYEIYFKDRPVYIYILMEFQSTVDKKMPIRFLRYILELYEDNGKNSETGLYPAIFPLLLYNGEAKWTAKRDISEIIDSTIPGKYIPNFKYYPILINEIEKKDLLNIHNAVSAIFYMENTNSRDYHKAIDDLVLLIKGSSVLEATVFANWVNNFLLSQGDELTYKDFDKIKKPEEVLPMMAANIERYREELISEGVNKEKIEIATNLLKEGSELEFVSKVTGLSIKALKYIKKST
ncbi:MAG: Rpn family recombination-promoting nuclease/putative transposase [Spirochaetaceae bacterium]